MIMERLCVMGKVALVTGSSRGLGKAIAMGLAEAGADLALVARSERLHKTAEEIKELGREGLAIIADVTKIPDIRRMTRETLDHFGHIDILVNAAGVNIREPILDVTEEDWENIVSVNQKGLFFCCQEVAKVMINQRRGKIINIGSITCSIGQPNISVYAGTKGAVMQMTKVMALEWARYNIQANVLAPGWFKTELTAPVFADERARTYFQQRIPAGRTGVPDELKGIAVFLASEASDYVTGQVFYVDGGWLGGELVPLPSAKSRSQKKAGEIEAQ